MNNKIKSAGELNRQIIRLKRNGKRIVFTNGCFDILHKGHIKLLKKAKSLGDILVVAINSNVSVRKIKGPGRPINTMADRAAVLSAISFVDYVTVFSEPDPGRIIGMLKPDILVKGGDWPKGRIIGRDIVEKYGGKVQIVKLKKGYSTTRLVNAIARRSR